VWRRRGAGDAGAISLVYGGLALKTGRAALLSVAAGVAGISLWWRRHPSACPYSQRFWVQAPHPFITRARLREALAPAPGERILEVGPGTGYYSLAVAEWIGPAGTLEIFDLQQEMLDHTTRAAYARGLHNIVATRGDARSLPYEDGRFDAAYLVTVLGEVPDQEAALRELARVIARGGRLVVGELFGDPHWVRFAALRERAQRSGLRFELRFGGPLGYFARFTPETPSEQLSEEPLAAKLGERALALLERARAHPVEDLRRLGELDLAVVDDLHVVAPGVDEVERSRRLDPQA
jgi:SAM-dependent methyltransferase